MATADTTIGGVQLTHPDKVLYPEQGITKHDLAVYLDAAADRMLPYLAGRLVSLVRCPDGQARKCFFQKHGGAGLPEQFRRFPVPGKNGGTQDYLYIDRPETLIAAAQMGVLEFHIWGSRIDALEKPDRMVFDLDPDPSVAFPEVRRAAKRVRDVLGALDLDSFALLTGGKGIHVVVPIVRRHDWPRIKSFSGALAQRLADDAPDKFVATMSKAKRHGRIFIDYFRNDRGATAIAPYSPRARNGAPVSWPVAWDKLDAISSPACMTIEVAIESLEQSDPWRGFNATRQSVKASAFRALGIVGES